MKLSKENIESIIWLIKPRFKFFLLPQIFKNIFYFFENKK